VMCRMVSAFDLARCPLGLVLRAMYQHELRSDANMLAYSCQEPPRQFLDMVPMQCHGYPLGSG
jgi:hypothetical protein